MSPATKRLPNALLAVLALAAFLTLLLPSVLGPPGYGYFIDEFYYVACSEHLDFGYVDHPPLAPLLLRASRMVCGDSVAGLRVLPALAAALTVLMTGLLARRLGAGAAGQGLAALAVMTPGIYLVMFGFYSMNAFEIPIWLGCFWVLIEIERRNEPRLWLLYGLISGIGLLNKHTIVLLGLALAVALLATRARRHLASGWLWAGIGIAFILALPNLLWQFSHDFISLEFYRNADLYKNVPTPPHEVALQQLLFMNPLAAPIWIAGVAFFLVTARGRPYRHVGLIFVILFGMMVIGEKSRPDRIGGIYPVAFAAGAVLLERLLVLRGGRWLLAAVALAVVAGGALFAPICLPILPAEQTAVYTAALGVVPQIERGSGKASQLPQWLADRLGWEQFVADVEAVVATLPAEDRQRAVIFAPSYGQAGALELLGRGLPPVYSTHNSYFLWGPPPDPVEVAIVAGDSPRHLRELFEQVDLAEIHDCEYCMPWRDQMPIWIVRGPKVSFAEIWFELRNLG